MWRCVLYEGTIVLHQRFLSIVMKISLSYYVFNKKRGRATLLTAKILTTSNLSQNQKDIDAFSQLLKNIETLYLFLYIYIYIYIYISVAEDEISKS